jgi:Uma2 family endonuclease
MQKTFKVPPAQAERLPPLEPGDHLDQKTFHARYEAMPENVRAELIGGVVYMSSPAKPRHGRNHGELITWLYGFKGATPGTDAADNTTVILREDSEPQPDGCLFILSEYGGSLSYNDEGYFTGAPELTAEVASSSESYDLNDKRRDYERAGVLEYVVVVLRQQRIAWFVRRNGVFTPLEPGADGIYRSEVFPGLWLDGPAMLARDTLRVQQVLQQGLASPEHARFVKELAKKKPSS